MDTTKIIEAITNLNEMELQEVIEAIEGYAFKNKMDHLLRTYSTDEIDEIRSELDEAEDIIKRLEEKNRSLNRNLNEAREKLEEIANLANSNV